MTDILTHRVKFVFATEQVVDDNSVQQLGIQLQSILTAGYPDQQFDAVGQLRNDVRQDTTDTTNVTLVASFVDIDVAKNIVALFANKKSPSNFLPLDEDEVGYWSQDEFDKEDNLQKDIWSDATVWKGFKCIATKIMPV